MSKTKRIHDGFEAIAENLGLDPDEIDSGFFEDEWPEPDSFSLLEELTTEAEERKLEYVCVPLSLAQDILTELVYASEKQ